MERRLARAAEAVAGAHGGVVRGCDREARPMPAMLNRDRAPHEFRESGRRHRRFPLGGRKSRIMFDAGRGRLRSVRPSPPRLAPGPHRPTARYGALAKRKLVSETPVETRDHVAGTRPQACTTVNESPQVSGSEAMRSHSDTTLSSSDGDMRLASTIRPRSEVANWTGSRRYGCPPGRACTAARRETSLRPAVRSIA